MIVSLAKIDPGNSIRLGAVSQHSPDCYAEANSRMLDAADILLTVTNGDVSKSNADSESLITEAKAHGLPCINIDPTAPAFSPAVNEAALTAFIQRDSESLRVFRDLKPHVTDDSQASREVANCLSNAAKFSSKSFRKAIAIAISLHALAGFIAAGAASYFYALHLDHSLEGKHHAHVILAFLAFTELLLVGSAFGLELRAKMSKNNTSGFSAVLHVNSCAASKLRIPSKIRSSHAWLSIIRIGAALPLPVLCAFVLKRALWI